MKERLTLRQEVLDHGTPEQKAAVRREIAGEIRSEFDKATAHQWHIEETRTHVKEWLRRTDPATKRVRIDGKLRPAGQGHPKGPSVGAELKALRKALHLSQMGLALETGCDPTNISRIERGLTGAGDKTIERLRAWIATDAKRLKRATEAGLDLSWLGVRP